MVDIVNDGRKVVAGRSGDDDVLCARIDVSLSLRLGGVEAGALENDVDIKIFPRKISSVLLGIDGDLLAVNDDGIVGVGNLVIELELALCGVILKKVSEHLRRGKVVDRDDLKTFCCVHLTESQTADTTETVNCNSYCHNLNPPVI